MKILKLFVPFIILLLAFLLIDCTSVQQGERASKTKSPEESTDQTKISEQLDTASVPEVRETPTEKVAIQEVKKDTIKTSVAKSDSTFTVQLGAFKEIKNVEKFEKTAKTEFPQVIIKTEYDGETQNYKVTAGQFQTKEEAYKFRAYCVEKGFKDAWVTSSPK